MLHKILFMNDFNISTNERQIKLKLAFDCCLGDHYRPLSAKLSAKSNHKLHCSLSARIFVYMKKDKLYSTNFLILYLQSLVSHNILLLDGSMTYISKLLSTLGNTSQIYISPVWNDCLLTWTIFCLLGLSRILLTVWNCYK